MAIWDGASPTEISRADNVSASTTLSVPVVDDPVTGSVTTAVPLEGAVVSLAVARLPARLVTNIRPRVLDTATENGAFPTATSFVIVCVAASITARVLLRLNATYALLPSVEKAMPAGSGWPLRSIRLFDTGNPTSES